MRRFLAAAGVAVLAACGGGGSSDGGGGNSTEVAFILPPTTCTGASFAGVGVLIARDRVIANACTQASNGCVEYANLTGISLIVVNFNATATATAVQPGTYTVGTPTGTSGTFATVGATKTDAHCNETLTGSANASGTITITAVSGSTVTGSYNVTAYGTPYSGNFVATVCSGFTGDVCSGDFTGTCTGTTQCLP